MPVRPVVLMILDGWGNNPTEQGNAVLAAKTPQMDRLLAEYPTSRLHASGEAVGIMDGQMGDSNVGHLNIGAGRIVYQDLVRLNKAVKEGEFDSNPHLRQAMLMAKEKGTALHLMGLVSPGGVHSHTNHLYALVRMAKSLGLTRVFIHAFLDGRDVPPSSAREYLRDLENEMQSIGLGRVATVSGRYYAMDRDKRWERTEIAYRAIVEGKGLIAKDSDEAVTVSYSSQTTDEFVMPTVIVGEDGGPLATVSDGDSVVFFNFRFDRARQLTRAFVDDAFDGFERQKKHVYFLCLTRYDETIQAPYAFEPMELTQTLGEVVSAAGKTQVRIAETEKYAHVTFFFNALNETPNPGEERILVPSPKVATYDLQPEMSAFEVAEKAVEAIKSGSFDLVVVNFANCDMVGHTGIFEAAVRAVEAVDACVGQVVEAAQSVGGALLITADHGNAEQMVDTETGEPHTYHTLNQVPFILVSSDKGAQVADGVLGDIAPTILELMEIPQPAEMTGKSLIRS